MAVGGHTKNAFVACSLPQQSVGWVYGPELSEELCQHPSIKPFGSLPKQERAGLLGPAEAALKYLLARGWTLSKVRHVELDSLPTKPQMTCIRPKKRRTQSQEGEEERPYQPSVADLSKVEVPLDLLVSCQSTESVEPLASRNPSLH